MATCPTDIASYVEEIETFTFRGDDGITIPKSVREQAYQLAIDVIIRSIPRETYKNYTVNPPESFYGNATIILQDMVEKKVPIRFPRQRIYEGRVPEAFEMWNALINFEYQRAYFLAVGESLQSLGTALGAGSIPAIFCCSLPEISWKELPIREAYFAIPFGTQYEVEVSYLRPASFSDSCGTLFEGLSRQVDGDKDVGLPAEGSFPRIAPNPANPYDGLPSASSDVAQGGFANGKTPNIDEPDPESEAMYTPPADRPVRLQVVCNFASTSAVCVNDVPQSAFIDMTFGALNEPYTVEYPLLSSACGGFRGVVVKNGSGATVPFGGCFNGSSCGKVGSGGAVVTWFYL